MAQMDRNVNLEEIDSDALFGIDALKNQSFLQKVVFFGCVLLGVAANVCLPLFFDVSSIICIGIFMVLLLIGVAFGCNYTEDMNYGKYLYFFFFKPTRHLLYESTEDVARIKKKAEEIKKEEELQLQKQRQADPAEQRKLLIRLVVFVAVLLCVVCGVLVNAGTKDDGVMHHVVNTESSGKE